MEAPISIILAEDSSIIQNLARKVFEMQGYKVSLVKNGKEVLEQMETNNFDMVVLDINMPIMNGMNCASAIRKLKDPKKSQTPIIAISGNVAGHTLEDFKKAGIDEYIPKPLNFDVLVEKVKKLL